jgi:hypothetical protein
MEFQITCECGRAVPVTEAAAGAAVQCACGRAVFVPALAVALPASEVSPGRIMQSSMTKFHTVSWLICTLGVAVCIGIVSSFFPLANRTAPPTFGECILGLTLVTIWLQLPYGFYHARVNQGQPCSGCAQLVLLAATGITGAFILYIVWDILRLLQSLVMTPPLPIRYSGGAIG